MAQPNWQKLDPNCLPEESGVYAFLWRKQWLYVGRAANLKQSLEIDPWPFKIAKSLDDAELLWMPADNCNQMASLLQRTVRAKWQSIAEEQYANVLYCALPEPEQHNQPMMARSLTHA